MLLKNEGFWSFSISFPGDGGLHIDDVVAITLEETADLSLPVANVRVRTKDHKIVKALTAPGVEVSLGVGDGGDDPKGVKPYKVFNKKVAQGQEGFTWEIDLWLVYSAMDFYDKHRTEVYNSHGDHQASSDVFSTIMGRNGLTPETKTTDDKMMWVQHNISDRKFLEDVFMKGWMGEGQPMMWGIRRDGKAKYMPIKDLMTIKGILGAEGGSNFMLSDYTMSSNDGFLSSWLGDTRHNPYHNMEEGIDGDHELKLKPFVTGESGFHENHKFAEVDFDNDNVHNNWLKAKSQNLQSRASLSSKVLEAAGSINYKDVYILDCYNAVLENPLTKEALTSFAGKWIVTKVKHMLAEGGYMCKASFSRETLQ